MIGAIIQARMGSTRFPEKVIKQIQGKTVLDHVIERVKRIKGVDKVILAVPADSINDVLEDIGKKQGIDIFRGSENNVLDRTYQAAKLYNIDHIVRITSDCPLLDHAVVEKVIKYYFDNNYDYASNVHPPTFPDGYDVEVFSFKALEKNWQQASTPEEKEHVWPYFYKIPNMFKTGNFKNDKDYSHIRLTLDEEKDFVLINEVFKELYNTTPYFGLEQVIDLFNKKPELIKINQDIEALEISRWQNK